MLESRPPDRKLDTGTSATRCAATDSSITGPGRRGGPAAASAATSATLPVVLARAACRPGWSAPRNRRAACGRPRWRSAARAPSNRASTRPWRPARSAARSPRRRPAPSARRRTPRRSPRRQVEQRLDAERVAGQEQLAGVLVGQREREHAAEPRAAPPAPSRRQASSTTSVSDDGAEADAAAGQLGPQLLVVVQLAVVDERQAVLGQRLVGRRRTGR